MKNNRRVCRLAHCDREPYLGGLCRKHHEEADHKEQRQEAAINLLHTSLINGSIVSDPELKKDWPSFQNYWRETCGVNIAQRGTDFIPLDEAEDATEWCIRLAEEIVDAELAFRGGAKPDYSSFQACKDWVWEKFVNLEKGLQSNGTARRKA